MSASRLPATKSSGKASVAQTDEDTEVYTGNAGTLSFDSSTPHFSHSLCWCADTGATSHMTPHRAWFNKYTPHSVPVHVVDGTVVRSTGIGSVHFRPVLQGSEVR